MKLYEGGVYLVNGHDIVEENSMTQPVSREEAAKNTMAYGILEAHNTSGNMKKLLWLLLPALAAYGAWDLVREVRGLEHFDAALAAGVAEDRIVLDPGIGFAKTWDHNWELIGHLERFVGMGHRVIVGASRKAFLGGLLDGRPPAGRDAATSASGRSGWASTPTGHSPTTWCSRWKTCGGTPTGSIPNSGPSSTRSATPPTPRCSGRWWARTC